MEEVVAGSNPVDALGFVFEIEVERTARPAKPHPVRRQEGRVVDEPRQRLDDAFGHQQVPVLLVGCVSCGPYYTTHTARANTHTLSLSLCTNRTRHLQSFEWRYRIVCCGWP